MMKFEKTSAVAGGTATLPRRFGTAWLCPLFALTATLASAAPSLIGETSRSTDSVFATTDSVRLMFRVTGLEPKQTGLTLKLAIVDDYGATNRTFDTKIIADVGGMDETSNEWSVPCGYPAFYRVYAALSDGTKVKTAWSDVPEGSITYCVLTNGFAGVKPVPAAAALAPFRSVLDTLPGGGEGESPLYDLSKGRPKAAAVKRTAPKDAYPLLQALAAFLENRTLVGEVTKFGDKVKAYSFRENGSDRVALALWAPGATPKSTVGVKVRTTASPSVLVMNRFGGISKVSTDSQKDVRVSLTSRPTFVFDVDPAALESAK